MISIAHTDRLVCERKNAYKTLARTRTYTHVYAHIHINTVRHT